MPEFSLADILGAQVGAPGPVYEGGPTGGVRAGDVLAAMARMPFPISMVSKAIGAAALPGDVASGRTEADLANPEYTGRAADLASFMVGSPGGSGGVGSGIRAYHGSPYDFAKFDLSRIGTGEGAQAYGHGLYFAENEATARSYRDALARASLPANEQQDLAQYAFSAARGNVDKAKQILNDDIWRYERSGWPTPDYRSQYDLALKKLEAGDVKHPGRMYEVNINAKPEQFLQHDAPLSQHSPETQQLLNQVYPVGSGGISGSDFYSALERHLHQPGQGHLDKAVASRTLNEAGIPGIKYLDQGSRNISPTVTALEDWLSRAKAGDKAYGPIDRLERQLADAKATPNTSNYVVFDPHIIDILKKYGLAGLTMGGVLQAQSEPSPQ